MSLWETVVHYGELLWAQPFFQNMVSIALGGGLVYKAQAIVAWIKKWIDRFTCTIITLNNQQYCPAYWFIDAKFRRDDDYTSIWSHKDHDEDSEIGLGQGTFYRWYAGRPCVIRKRRVEQQNEHYFEIEIKTWFNRKLKKMLKEEKDKTVVRQIKIRTKNLGVNHTVTPSVHLPTDGCRTLHKGLERLQTLWAAGKHVRASYLLHGCPGEGKSQAIKNICISLGLNLKIIYLDPKTTNVQLIEEIAFCDRTAVVIEDIDRYQLFTKETDAVTEFGHNKAGILNMLDGILSPKNIVLIGTTNNIGKLDPAILRSGRFDTHIEFKSPTDDDIRALFKKELERDATKKEFALMSGKTLADVYKILNDLIIQHYECKNITEEVKIKAMDGYRRLQLRQPFDDYGEDE